MDMLASGGMFEAQCLGVEGLAGQQPEGVLDKLLVVRKGCAFQYSVSTVGCVVEKRMADVTHVGADLVGTPRFEDALYQGDVAEALHHAPVCDGMLAAFGVVCDVHHAAVLG